MILEVNSSFNGIFLLIRILYLQVLFDILFGGGLHVILRGRLSEVYLCDYDADSTCARV